MIVQQLHEIQQRHGYLPDDELRRLSSRTGTRLYRLQEVASFYPHFRLRPPPRLVLQVCRDMSCQLRGSCQILKALQEKAAVGQNQVVVQGVSCLGRCDRAPVACATNHHAGETDRFYMPTSAEQLNQIVQVATEQNSGKLTNLPQGNQDATRVPDAHESWQIDIYAGKPGDKRYQSIRRFVERSAGLDLNLGDEMDPSAVETIDQAVADRLADPGNLGPPFRQEPDPERKRVIAALYTAGLLGMGGAGGRTYKKWFDVRKAKGTEKYVVCNADESEPGTFKDREILLRAPHLVIEGVVLAGLLVKATCGYIYMRHEYPEQIESVRFEIARAEQQRICGENILGSGISFPVHVFVSPGGYICGEQTALIEAIEDKRAEPRNRPPELQTNGLWDKPTLLNNVETLAWVPAIVTQNEGTWFAEQGKGKFQGRRFFSISGDVARPGVYEVPIGISLGALIDEYAGGMRDGQELKAAALSGPSGGFLPRWLPVEYLRESFVSRRLPKGTTSFDIRQTALDIPTSREMGIMLGAGIIIYGQNANMVTAAASCTEFYRNESCGKCVPCRIGTQKLVEILDDIVDRKISADQLYADNAANQTRALIKDLADTMRLTAICGLGTVAPNPIRSLLDHFRDDVEQFLK